MNDIYIAMDESAYGPIFRPLRHRRANMTPRKTLLSLAGFVAAALLSVLVSAAHAQSPLSLNPTAFPAGAPAVMTITSNGFLDLSRVTASRISVSPSSGISNLQITSA